MLSFTPFEKCFLTNFLNLKKKQTLFQKTKILSKGFYKSKFNRYPLSSTATAIIAHSKKTKKNEKSHLKAAMALYYSVLSFCDLR